MLSAGEIFRGIVRRFLVEYNVTTSQLAVISGGKAVLNVADERMNGLSPEQAALLEKHRARIERGFRGVYLHGLDTKGRMIIPAVFRQALGEKFCVCMAPNHDAIAIYPRLEWELQYCALLDLMEKDSEAEYLVTLFAKYSYEDCECDAQGRVLLPQLLRNKILDNAKDVEISGAGTYIRVMRSEDAQRGEEEFLSRHPNLIKFRSDIEKGVANGSK